MTLPSAERIVLKTYSDKEYRQFMTQRATDFSLLRSMSMDYTELSLNQEIPGNSMYPPLQVVDIIPATTCKLSDSSTLIVITPASFLTAQQKAWRVVEDEEIDKPNAVAPMNSSDDKSETEAPTEMFFDKMSFTSRLVRIQLCDQCSGSVGLGNKMLYEQLFLENDSVLAVECELHKTIFSVRLDSCSSQHNIPADASTPRVLVGHMVFLNIRQVAAYRAAYRSELCISYHTSFFEIPLEWLIVMEDATGRSLLSSMVPVAATVAFSPAFENFILESLYGESYLALVDRQLQSAGPEYLDSLLVSEGDIITLPYQPATGGSSHPNVSEEQIISTELQTTIHKLDHWDAIHEDHKDLQSLSFLSLRVAALLPQNEMGSTGVIQLSGKRATTIVTAHQSLYISPIYVAPVLSPQKGYLCDVEFKANARKCFEACLYSGKFRRISFFTAQGLPENLCTETLKDTAKEYGLPTCFLNLEGLQSKDLSLFLNQLVNKVNIPLVVLLVSSTNKEPDPDILFPFLDSYSVEEQVLCPPIIIFYVSETVESISPLLSSRSLNSEGVIVCSSSTESNRKVVVDYALKKLCNQFHVHPSLTLSLDNIASWTTGLSIADIFAYCMDCVNEAVSAYQLPPFIHSVLSEGKCEEVLQRYLNAHGHNLVSTKLHPVQWSDVGGLEDAKKELQEAIQLPLMYPEVFANGMKRRSGILFYGPPGCGKTLLAKAVATEMNMNFISVKGPELLNQYVGESERNIRALFQRARDSSPCIVFFDELDALAPARGSKGDGGGAMDRVVSQLLVEVDGVGQKKSDGTDGGQIIIIGATNRPDLLDPSLLRPGRFDRLCYLGIPSSKEEQLFAVRALTRKFNLDPDVSLEALIEPLECVYTGADFFALCSDAMMHAVGESIQLLRAKIEQGLKVEDTKTTNSYAENEEDIPIITVKMEHFLQARDTLKPSVTKGDLARYESLKTKFSV